MAVAAVCGGWNGIHVSAILVERIGGIFQKFQELVLQVSQTIQTICSAVWGHIQAHLFLDQLIVVKVQAQAE